MAIENEINLESLISIAKRRWGMMSVVLAVVVVLALLVALFTPSTYKSTGTISVETQQISPDIVQSHEVVSYANERIDSIKQRVMSKDSLNRIAQKYKLYAELKDPKNIAEAMTKATSIELQTRDKSADQWSNEKVTIAFTVGFENTSPEMAHKVANELVSLFLDENAKLRTKRATETTEFLTSELTRLKADLETTENKVAAYKQSHSGALPENMQLHMGMLQSLDQNIKDVDRDYKATQEELRYLDVELTNAQTAALNNSTQVPGSAGAASELEKAKAELDRDLVLYKETHPTIRALRRKIEMLEKSSATADPKPAKPNLVTDLAITKIQAQIDAAKVRMSSLADQKKSLQRQMADLQGQVSQTPVVERGLFALMRDYENAKAKYDEVKSKQVNAKIAENMELENKGDRFVLLEAPEYPDKRYKPNRRQILGIGLLLGAIAAIAAALLFEALDSRVRGVENLASVLNVRPLAVIPYINTQSELKRKQYLTKNAIIVGSSAAVLLLLIVYLISR